MDKLEEGHRTVKAQREDILRLLDQYEQARQGVEVWKREKRGLEDDLLLAKREKRDAMAERDRAMRVAEEEKEEWAKQVKLWQGVARKAEDDVVRARGRPRPRRASGGSVRSACARSCCACSMSCRPRRSSGGRRRRSGRGRGRRGMRRSAPPRTRSDRTLATLRLSWEQEKGRALTLERELLKARDDAQAKELRLQAQMDREREEMQGREERERREREGLRLRLAGLEEEKERLEGMVESMIGRVEEAMREKREREEGEERERAQWRERLTAAEREVEASADDWKRRWAQREGVWEEERKALKQRVELERGEKRERCCAWRGREGREEERGGREEALRALEEARSVMAEWRVEREGEEERRRKDRRERKERKERLWRQERELEGIRRQVRKETGEGGRGGGRWRSAPQWGSRVGGEGGRRGGGEEGGWEGE